MQSVFHKCRLKNYRNVEIKFAVINHACNWFREIISQRLLFLSTWKHSPRLFISAETGWNWSRFEYFRKPKSVIILSRLKTVNFKIFHPFHNIQLPINHLITMTISICLPSLCPFSDCHLWRLHPLTRRKPQFLPRVSGHIFSRLSDRENRLWKKFPLYNKL